MSSKQPWFPILCFLFAFGAVSISWAADRKPNVVFILADDMGWGDPRCYNPASKISTPNLDRLAREGMRFTDAHSPSSVCTPTRYGILTGRYCWRTRLKKYVLGPYGMPLLERDRLTMPRIFRKHAYSTAAVGKWHLGLRWQRNDGEGTPSNANRVADELIDLRKPYLDGPCNHGFDSYFGVDLPNFPPYCFLKRDGIFGSMPDRPKPETMFGTAGRMQKGWTLEPILPTIGRKATDYVTRRARNESGPFFLYLALTAPHTPIVPNREFRGTTQATLYGDFVAEVDAIVGRVLATLDESGLARDTIVVFTSDNGSPGRNGENASGPPGTCFRDSGHNPSGPWRGRKGDIHEGGHRVPLLVRWPRRVRAASVSDELICLTDFHATFAAMLGETLPGNAGEDSRDMLPVLLGRKLPEPIRESIIHHSHHGMFAIRVGPWKLILGKGTGSNFTEDRIAPDAPKGQLYNLDADPEEQHNLYRKQPDVVDRLTGTLNKQIEAGRSSPKPES